MAKASAFSRCYHCDSFFSGCEDNLVSFHLFDDDTYTYWRHESLIDCIKALGSRIESLEANRHDRCN